MWCNRITRRSAPLWRLYWDMRLEPHRAIPDEGPLLLAANHSSYLDPWFLGMLFPRPVQFVINRTWYDRSRVWRHFFDANGVIPVHPQRPDATLRAVAERLARGAVVALFPEGRISPDGRLQRFRPGLSHVAARTGVPVLPVWIDGAHESFPKSRRLPRPGRIRVRTGGPRVFPQSPTAGPLPRELVSGFQKEVREAVRDLAAAEGATVNGLDGHPSSI